MIVFCPQKVCPLELFFLVVGFLDTKTISMFFYFFTRCTVKKLVLPRCQIIPSQTGTKILWGVWQIVGMEAEFIPETIREICRLFGNSCHSTNEKWISESLSFFWRFVLSLRETCINKIWSCDCFLTPMTINVIQLLLQVVIFVAVIVVYNTLCSQYTNMHPHYCSDEKLF